MILNDLRSLQSISICFQGLRWFLLDAKWLSIVINDFQWPSMIINDLQNFLVASISWQWFQWFPLELKSANASQWCSLIFNDFQLLLMSSIHARWVHRFPTDFNWLSMIASGVQWYLSLSQWFPWFSQELIVVLIDFQCLAIAVIDSQWCKLLNDSNIFSMVSSVFNCFYLTPKYSDLCSMILIDFNDSTVF